MMPALLMEHLEAAAGDDDLVAEGAENFCETPADAGASAGDEDCVAGEIHDDQCLKDE
jgi:hypothetical protein